MGSKNSKPDNRRRYHDSGGRRINTYPGSSTQNPYHRDINTIQDNVVNRRNRLRQRLESRRDRDSINRNTRSNYVVTNDRDEIEDEDAYEEYYLDDFNYRDMVINVTNRNNVLKKSKKQKFFPLKNYHLIKLEENDLKLQDECPICLDELKIGDSVYLLPCCHYYHKDCLRDWVVNQSICPSCRLNIGKHKQDEIDMAIFTREEKLNEVKKNNKPKLEQKEDESTDESTDESSNKSTNESSDESIDNEYSEDYTDKSSDESTDNSTDESTNNSTDEYTDESLDESSYKSSDKSTDKSSDKSIDESSDSYSPDYIRLPNVSRKRIIKDISAEFVGQSISQAFLNFNAKINSIEDQDIVNFDNLYLSSIETDALINQESNFGEIQDDINSQEEEIVIDEEN